MPVLRFVTVLLLLGLISFRSSAESLDEQIKEKEGQIKVLQQRLDPLVQPLLVNKDARLWISQVAIGRLVAFVNSLPPQSRHLAYISQRTSGQLKNSNGGAAGCGWYVELDRPNGAQFDLNLSNLGFSWVGDGTFGLRSDAFFQFGAVVHGHVKAPAGLCFDPWPKISCDCPLGGGFGIHTDTNGNRAETFSVVGRVWADAASWLKYDVSLASPPKVPISIEVFLRWPTNGSLGVGIPTDVDMPIGTLSAGSLDSIFQSEGTIEIKNPVSFKKQYTIKVTPDAIKPDSTGYAAVADFSATFH